MKPPLIISALALSISLFVSVVDSQQLPEVRVIEEYEPARTAEPGPLRYPTVAALRGSEGWVEFNFMVSPDGQPYEISVVDHVGDDAFIDAARVSLEQTEFIPARIGGEIVHGSSRKLFRFELIGGMKGDGARRLFAGRYRRFMSTVESESQHAAASALEELASEGTRNNYEHAYLSLARYSYALKYGTATEQMERLKAALGESVGNPEMESYLQSGALAARRSLAQLQLRNSHFGEAMDTFEIMRLKGDEEGIKSFQGAIEQLEALRINEVAYPVAGRINDNGSWLISLFKRRFYVSDLSGHVDELKLRCQQNYFRFEFDPELQYDVLDSAGECTLELVGDAHTTFTLIQF